MRYRLVLQPRIFTGVGVNSLIEEMKKFERSTEPKGRRIAPISLSLATGELTAD